MHSADKDGPTSLGSESLQQTSTRTRAMSQGRIGSLKCQEEKPVTVKMSEYGKAQKWKGCEKPRMNEDGAHLQNVLQAVPENFFQCS